MPPTSCCVPSSASRVSATALASSSPWRCCTLASSSSLLRSSSTAACIVAECSPVKEPSRLVVEMALPKKLRFGVAGLSRRNSSTAACTFSTAASASCWLDTEGTFALTRSTFPDKSSTTRMRRPCASATAHTWRAAAASAASFATSAASSALSVRTRLKASVSSPSARSRSAWLMRDSTWSSTHARNHGPGQSASNPARSRDLALRLSSTLI
mmetsp:Transcript_46713/g.82337  ORF Transcript_46713/g.82337 Transcript_46713/m.82337 type:complete len:213 (-) Transcript_46713:356-994(-)